MIEDRDKEETPDGRSRPEGQEACSSPRRCKRPWQMIQAENGQAMSPTFFVATSPRPVPIGCFTCIDGGSQVRGEEGDSRLFQTSLPG